MKQLITYFILLATLVTLDINATAGNANVFSYSAEEIATSREIARIKKELKQSKFYASQSAIESCIDILGVTLLGSAVGTIAGLAQISTIKGENGAGEYGPATVLQVILQIMQGSSSGFFFGIAGQAGSRPQLSKTKLLCFLILQSIVTFGLMKFIEVLIQTPTNNNFDIKVLIGVLTLITGFLGVVAECIIIRSMRQQLLVEKQALEEALTDLQRCHRYNTAPIR